jgi:hypothetical protein
LFALELIELMIAGKNILSIDEASFSQAAFYRSGWGFAGENMRHVTKPLGHRLTLTAAFDTDGKSYFAVSQATSDAERFCTFMYKLAKLLDKPQNPKTPSIRQIKFIEDGKLARHSQRCGCPS